VRSNAGSRAAGALDQAGILGAETVDTEQSASLQSPRRGRADRRFGAPVNACAVQSDMGGHEGCSSCTVRWIPGTVASGGSGCLTTLGLSVLSDDRGVRQPSRHVDLVEHEARHPGLGLLGPP
jgi:hypothetical protein